MWNAECLESQQTHVETRARERLLHASRIYQEPLKEEEAKQKILEIMRSCTVKDYKGIDFETSLPKYKLRKKLPDSLNIYVILIVVENNETKIRKLKTLYTNYDELSPEWKH